MEAGLLPRLFILPASNFQAYLYDIHGSDVQEISYSLRMPSKFGVTRMGTLGNSARNTAFMQNYAAAVLGWTGTPNEFGACEGFLASPSTHFAAQTQMRRAKSKTAIRMVKTTAKGVRLARPTLTILSLRARRPFGGRAPSAKLIH